MRAPTVGGTGFICGDLSERFVVDGHSVVLDNFGPVCNRRINRHTVGVCRECVLTSTNSSHRTNGVRNQVAPNLDIKCAECHGSDAGYAHADSLVAHKRPGYEPSQTLFDGIENYIEWYWTKQEWHALFVLEN